MYGYYPECRRTITELVIDVSEAQLRFVTNNCIRYGAYQVRLVVILFDNQISKDIDLYKLYNTNIHEKKRDSQYPTLTVNYTGVFQDRFLIIDEATAYHIGASIKDAGKKCFGISRIEDIGIISDILERLEIETEEVNN